MYWQICANSSMDYQRDRNLMTLEIIVISPVFSMGHSLSRLQVLLIETAFHLHIDMNYFLTLSRLL